MARSEPARLQEWAFPGYNPDTLLERVSRYDNFGPDNDPHGERNFGKFCYCGQDLFWKIDYYDKDRQFLSPDPADRSVTERILTIMLASEY